MADPAVASPVLSELESALLGVLLTADSLRQGAEQLLEVLGPYADDSAIGLALRDRDGFTLHVLAELGPPQAWPDKLEPQFAVSGGAGVDAATNTFIVPLRANGRVVAALLFGDHSVAAELMRSDTGAAFDTIAAVMQRLAARVDAEIWHRATSTRSAAPVLEGIAHQIANPLTGASAIAQLLVDEISDDSQRAAVHQIMQELGRTFTALKDLLEFQRDTMAQDGLLDLNAVVEKALRFRGYAIREQGIALDVETTPGYLPVRADLRGLEHALLLVLRYAELQSHGTVNRSIGVRVSERGTRELAVDIIDSGPGNAPDLTPRYLDIALGASTARNADDEPDLGLAASIVRSFGGRIECVSSKEDGTTLTLVLPRAATVARASNPPRSTPASGRMSS